MSNNLKNRKKCKRCDKFLSVYKDHQLCPHCWFLKQFRPQEYDPEAWEKRVIKEATPLCSTLTTQN